MSGLQRTFSRRTAIAVVIGNIIGSGIFMKPSVMMQQLGSPWLLLGVWAVAGLVTLVGALSNSEVAAMYPETGGQYVFFQKMYGDRFAFLYGWAAFAVFNSASAASIAYIFSQYAGYFWVLPRLDQAAELSVKLHIPLVGDIFPLANIGVKALTVLIILFLTVVNYRSVHTGGLLQRLLTDAKNAAIFLLIAGILFSGRGEWSHYAEAIPRRSDLGLIGALVAAMSGAFWGYDGWNNVTFIAGEIKDPQRNLPASLITGLLVCFVLYVLSNVAYIYALSPGAMASSKVVAADAASAVWGAAGGAIIAGLVMLCTFGAANSNSLTAARVTYAMGQDNRAFAWAGKTHASFHTPGNALWLNAAWSSVLVVSGSFDMLTDMLIFVSWFFYGMSALGVFVLRKKYPDHPRPYKVPGYPLLPAIFVLFTLFFLVMTLYQDITSYNAGKVPVINSLLGILITVAGLFFAPFQIKRSK
ncbi:MAG: amino acid permease [Flavihumibacter sp.]